MAEGAGEAEGAGAAGEAGGAGGTAVAGEAGAAGGAGLDRDAGDSGFRNKTPSESICTRQDRPANTPTSGDHPIRNSVCALIVIASFGAGDVEAQSSEWEAPTWLGDLAYGATNAIFAGVSAGIIREIRGGSFRDGFAAGALGGAVVFGGKRLASGGFWGAGLIAREISAIGSSITHSGANGQPLLSELVVPFGPLHFYLRPGQPDGLSVRVSGTETAAIIWAVTRPELEFDFDRSVSSGAFVFVAPRRTFEVFGHHAFGVMASGIILLSPIIPTAVLVHEQVHVIQRDFFNIVAGTQIESSIGRRVKPVGFVRRFVDLDVAGSALGYGFNWLFRGARDINPFELEADFIDPR